MSWSTRSEEHSQGLTDPSSPLCGVGLLSATIPGGVTRAVSRGPAAQDPPFASLMDIPACRCRCRTVPCPSTLMRAYMQVRADIIAQPIEGQGNKNSFVVVMQVSYAGSCGQSSRSATDLFLLLLVAAPRRLDSRVQGVRPSSAPLGRSQPPWCQSWPACPRRATKCTKRRV